MNIQQSKYIAMTKTRILCLKGWILKSRLNTNQIKLFETPAHIKQFLETQIRYNLPKYDAVKVKVTYEIEVNE